MVKTHTRLEIAEKAIVHADVPVRRQATVDRTFELPTALYGTMVALLLGYIAVMAIGFASPQMILPVAIFVLFIVAGFGVPALWTRLAPAAPTKAKSWARFQAEGIQTAFGPSRARDATVQVLILPVLLFAWGLAVVTIAALV